jgi:transposase
VGRPSKWPEEFKRDAVALVDSTGRAINDVARELGISHETLRSWVNRARGNASTSGLDGAGHLNGSSHAGLSQDERAELRRLRRRVSELEDEKEVLRRAVIYFARELGR